MSPESNNAGDGKPAGINRAELARHAWLGSAWMIAMRWCMRLIGLVSTVILARLLLPEDFGIIAMAMIVVGLLEIIAFTGVDLALIRDDSAGRAHYDTAWTVKIIQGLLIAALLMLAAPAAASYFHEPRVTLVIQLLALKSLFDGLENIGVVAFRKELNFAKEFRFNLYKKLINFVVVVAAAVTFRNYWSLVIGIVSAAAISTLLSYRMHAYRPHLSLSKFSEIWSFSQWLLVSRVGFFLNRKTAQFVIGGISGTTAMGSYHVASQIATMPSEELVMPMRRALFPVLSKSQHNPSAFADAVRQTFASTAILCSLLGFGLAAVADLFVPLVLGQHWLDTVPLMRWLAVSGVFVGLLLILEMPLWVQNRTALSALQAWLELAILVPLTLLATQQFGAEGAAASRMLVSAAMVPLIIYLASRVCTLRMMDLLAELWRPFIAGAAMAAALMQLSLSADGLVQTALLLVFKIVLGGVIYLVLLLLLWLLAGRPAGAEAMAIAKLGGLRRAYSSSR